MGGKGGGPLASWIREFTTLVFVQTVQAFIFAIIMVVIMGAMSNQGAINNDDYNSAVGLMCVFALTSLFKVEEMVRRIFGLGNTKADHRGALQSIAKTAFALKLGKRALDNGKKIIGGAAKIKGARGDAKKANKRLQEDRQDLGLSLAGGRTNNRNNNTAVGGGQQGQTQQSTPLLSDVTQTVNESQNKPRLTGQDLMKKAIEAKKNGDMDGYKNRSLQAGINNARKEANENKTPEPVFPKPNGIPQSGNNVGNTSQENVGTGGTSGTVRMSTSPVQLDMTDDEVFSSNEIDLKTKQKLRAAQRTAEDALKNARKMRNEGIKDIAKGLAETGGAMVVGPMGAVLGGADGDIEGAINGLLSGVGLGDAIGEKAVDATVGMGKFAQNRAKNVQNFNSEMQEIKRSMKEEDKSFGEAIKTRVKARTGAIRELQKNTEDLKTYLDNVQIKSNKSNNSRNAYRNSVDDT